MSPRILATTKLTPPALPIRYVPRPRVHAALDAGAGCPLTIVVGVPGAGKSVALESWLQDRPEPRSVWLSCDGRETDPVDFWLALSAALTRTWPGRGLDLIDVLAATDPDLDEAAIATVNDLAELAEPTVIVIDDFHFADAAAPSVNTLVERLPAGCRLVVGSRTEPPLALHRLRAHGQLHEVRDADLRLTSVEVATMMREFGVELDDEGIAVVTEHTDGWMAGIQMAAVSLRDISDPDQFLARLQKTPRAITDFLGTEVLDRQPEEIRDFLLATSVLHEFDAESCNAVTGRRDARVMLHALEDRNLFLIELDHDVYRYHHLFADLLRLRLRADGPERERDLHLRAAAFYADVGDPEYVITHLLAAGDDEAAFETLRTGLVRAFYRGDGRIPHRLFLQLELHAHTIDPAHLPDIALAVAASGPAGEAQPWVARARKHLAGLDDAARARLAVAEGIVGMQEGDPAGIARALADRHDPGALLEHEIAHSVPSLLTRSQLWLGEIHAAREICETFLEDLDEPSVPHTTMTSALAWVACVEGRLTEADELAQRAITGAEAIGVAGHPIMEGALRARGRVAFERGDLVTAEHLLERSIAINEQVRPAFVLVSQLSLARVWLAGGRVGDALEGVAHARALLRPGITGVLPDLCLALEGRIALEVGDLDRAEDCLRAMAPGNRAAVLGARLAIARGDWEQAAAAVDCCSPVTLREQLDVTVLAARIAHGARADDADAMIAAALAVAKPEGFVVVVTDDMVELRPRVALLLRSGRIGTFEQTVLDRIDDGLPLVKQGDASKGPLSDRELTVVRYLASRLTNQEIANELFVSSNTLKTHVKRIYQKLGVSSRREAVGEARRLGLM